MVYRLWSRGLMNIEDLYTGINILLPNCVFSKNKKLKLIEFHKLITVISDWLLGMHIHNSFMFLHWLVFGWSSVLLLCPAHCQFRQPCPHESTFKRSANCKYDIVCIQQYFYPKCFTFCLPFVAATMQIAGLPACWEQLEFHCLDMWTRWAWDWTTNPVISGWPLTGKNGQAV